MSNDLNIAQDGNKRQFGFKKGCSTEAALHKVTHLIERRIAEKGYVLGVSLDIEGAFFHFNLPLLYECLYSPPFRNTKLHPINHKTGTMLVQGFGSNKSSSIYYP